MGGRIVEIDRLEARAVQHTGLVGSGYVGRRVLVTEVGAVGRVEHDGRRCDEFASRRDLDAPVVRVTTPHIPLPAAAELEDLAIPSANDVVDAVVQMG